ncbi:MAG: substrate-binding domain-containing protein [Victivallales bacterium]|nr:substrate-binding domain-containing protein [Victivallales bacterium]
MVLLGCPKGGEPISSCGADGSLGIKISIEHIIENGRIQIACLIDENSRRCRPIAVQTMLDHQLTLCPELLVYAKPWSFEDGRNAVNRLLNDNISFNAIVCYGDQATLGAINAITSAGLRIPSDVALVICGSNTWCRQMAGFTLTGAWQDIPAIMGKVVQLLEMEKNGHPQRHMHWIAPNFIIGDSCGAINSFNHKTNIGGIYEKA